MTTAMCLPLIIWTFKVQVYPSLAENPDWAYSATLLVVVQFIKVRGAIVEERPFQGRVGFAERLPFRACGCVLRR